MKIFFLVLCLNFHSIESLAVGETTKCFNTEKNMEAKGELQYAELSTEYLRGNFKAFDSKFRALCEKYKNELICRIENSSPKKSDLRTKQLVKNDVCSEVYRVPHGGGDDTLYLLSDRKTHLQKD